MTAFATTPDISIGAFRVWQRNRDVFLQLWKTDFLGIAVEPWIVILAMGLGLGQFVELASGEDYVTFLAPGLLALFPMFAAVFECAWGSYVRLEMQGTYNAIIATPVSVDDVIAGEILWGTTRSMINVVYIMAVLLVLTPWLDMVDSPMALLCLPVAIIPGILFSAISISFASVARAMSQFSYFFNLVVIPMFWFAGAFFPFDELPQWAQVLGWFIPLKHVVDIYRGLFAGNLEWSMLVSLVWLMAVTVVFFLLATWSMRRRLIN
ncbi:MAG: ABC transporter permease [Dehalococcoidia bacterium]